MTDAERIAQIKRQKRVIEAAVGICEHEVYSGSSIHAGALARTLLGILDAPKCKTCGGTMRTESVNPHDIAYSGPYKPCPDCAQEGKG